MTEKREYIRSSDELPRYDPTESVRIGLDLLEAADVPFALAGRLAVWTYVPPAGQQFTKDVDFAVPYGSTEKLARAARERGYKVSYLSIGGIGVTTPAGSIDFIDRHPHLSELFADAVKAAQEKPKRVRSAGAELTVVPFPHLVAMKMVSGESSDDRDVEELLLTAKETDYRQLRELVARHLGHASAERLDVLARRIGHPGPGMKSRYKDSGQDSTGKDVGEDA